MKKKYTFLLMAFMIFTLLCTFSACNSNKNNGDNQGTSQEQERILKVKGGPDTFQAYINEAYCWDELSSNEKIGVIDACISSCQNMKPSEKYTLSGYIYDSEDVIFEWDSSKPEVYYEYAAGKRTQIPN